MKNREVQYFGVCPVCEKVAHVILVKGKIHLCYHPVCTYDRSNPPKVRTLFKDIPRDYLISDFSTLPPEIKPMSRFSVFMLLLTLKLKYFVWMLKQAFIIVGYWLGIAAIACVAAGIPLGILVLIIVAIVKLIQFNP